MVIIIPRIKSREEDHMLDLTEDSNGVCVVSPADSFGSVGADWPGLSVVYIVVDHGRAAVIDTASNASVPHILTALASLGIEPEAVDWVVLTHLHHDHGSGAGSLMCALPRARLVLHPRSVRQVIAPALLWNKASVFPGSAQTLRLFGRPMPVDESRIIPSHDGMELPLGERVLRVLDAPGHVWHHIVVWDEVGQAFFTGDAFGQSHHELNVGRRAFVLPASSSMQFDPDAMLSTIERMLAYEPQAMYLTHYGKLTDVERAGGNLCRLIHAQMAVARAARGEGAVRHAEILAGLEQLLREERARQQWALDDQASLELLRDDLKVCARGLGVWLDLIQAAEAAETTEAVAA
jgi:hydroxyacylglutathione hydrolase